MLNNKRKGVTLIELLVVVAIIGLLSAVVLAALNSARLKARDVRRVSDLREIEKALQMYYNDHDGTYPATANSCYLTTHDWPTAFKTALAPYMPQIPLDPNNNVCDIQISGINANSYSFANPIWFVWTPSCSSANNPPTIFLANAGEPGAKVYINDCNLWSGTWGNTIILNK